MGTPAAIAVQTGKEVTWCHINYDGYVEGAGRTLVEHYNTEELAKSLIAGGDISVLHKSIECPEGHSFMNPVKGFTIYYKRDRGETNVDPQKGDYFHFLHCTKRTIKYLYKDGTWYWLRVKSTPARFVDQWELLPIGEVLSGLHD